MDTDVGAVASIRGLATAEWSGTVRNTMELDGHKAVIQFHPDIDMFRGEFIGLNGGADFYARDIAGLRKEGAASLKVFLEMCEEDGVEPRRWYSGKFNLRISPEMHVISAADPARKETSRTLDRWTGPNDSLASLWANPANCSFWPFNGTARSPGLGCTEMKLRPFQRERLGSSRRLLALIPI